ncbi:MAG: hypothetical protein ACR2QQ_10580, partial [Gammaproteobacteria bacterium]
TEDDQSDETSKETALRFLGARFGATGSASESVSGRCSHIAILPENLTAIPVAVRTFQQVVAIA